MSLQTGFGLERPGDVFVAGLLVIDWDLRSGFPGIRKQTSSLRHAGIPDVLSIPAAEVVEAEQIRLVPQYEHIREQLVRAGLKVERLPILHTNSHGVYTWNNALVERRPEGRRAYVPVYGIPWLDDQALATYRKLGFETFPIDVSRIMHLGGTVRCVTNVLTWSGAAPPPEATPAELHPRTDVRRTRTMADLLAPR